MIPSGNVAIIIIKVIFCINLICSYSIVIYPTNVAMENWLCGCFKNSKMKLYWAQNFSRFLVALSAVIVGIYLASKLTKFLGLVGSLLCAPLALTTPALLHYRHIAKTRIAKMEDLAYILFSIAILFFCTIQTLMGWNTEIVVSE